MSINKKEFNLLVGSGIGGSDAIFIGLVVSERG